MNTFIFFLLFNLNFFILYNSKFLRKKIKLSNNNYFNFVSKINSIIHAKIVVILSILLLFNIISIDSWSNWLSITRGYCLYDILFIIMFYPNKLMIFHHLLLFFGSFSSYTLIFPFKTAQGLLSENTNQHLYLGWLLIKKGKQKTWGFKLNAFILLLEFFILRVLNFMDITLYSYYNCNSIEFYILLSITIMNIYWFYLLLKKIF